MPSLLMQSSGGGVIAGGAWGMALQSSLAMVLNALEIDPRRTWKVRRLWPHLGLLPTRPWWRGASEDAVRSVAHWGSWQAVPTVVETSISMGLLVNGAVTSAALTLPQGRWRWFDERMLDCCEPTETVSAVPEPLTRSHSVCPLLTAQLSISPARPHTLQRCLLTHT